MNVPFKFPYTCQGALNGVSEVPSSPQEQENTIMQHDLQCPQYKQTATATQEAY